MSSISHRNPSLMVFWSGKAKSEGFERSPTFYRARQTVDRVKLLEI
jgi:hypothetical protein